MNIWYAYEDPPDHMFSETPKEEQVDSKITKEGNKGEKNDTQSTSDGKFSLQLGNSKLKPKICRFAKDSQRKDVEYLFALFSSTFVKDWRDISKLSSDFPLVQIKNIEMVTLSDGGLVTLENVHVQRDTNVYRYTDTKVTISVYKVGYGGIGRDASLKNGGIGNEYGISAESLIPSKINGDYSKMLKFVFKDGNMKKANEKNSTVVKFPLNSPPFSILLKKKNADFSDKLKQGLKSGKKNKVADINEDGPFIYFCSSKYEIPSLDISENRYWAFCFNRTNLLYIMDVQYGEIDSLGSAPASSPKTSSSSSSTPPPPSDIPPPPLKQTSQNTDSSKKFNKRTNTRQFDQNQDVILLNKPVVSDTWYDTLNLSHLSLYSKSIEGEIGTHGNTVYNFLSPVINCVGENLHHVISRGAISPWIFTPLFGFNKHFNGVKDVLEPADLQNIKLFSAQSMLESEMIQRIKMDAFPKSHSKGYFVYLAKRWLSQESVNNSDTFMDFKSWILCLRKHETEISKKNPRLVKRYSASTAIKRTLSDDFTDLNVAELKPELISQHMSVYQVVSCYVTIRTLLGLLHKLLKVYDDLDFAMADKTLCDAITYFFPKQAVVRHDYDLIPQEIPRGSTEPIQRTNYAYTKKIVSEDVMNYEKTLTPDKEFYFTTEDGNNAWIQLEKNRTENLFNRLKKMNNDEEPDDIITDVNDAAMFGCALISYIDYLSYSHYQHFSILVLVSQDEAIQQDPVYKFSDCSWQQLAFMSVQSAFPLVKKLEDIFLFPHLFPNVEESDLSKREASIRKFYSQEYIQNLQEAFLKRVEGLKGKNTFFSETVVTWCRQNFVVHILPKISACAMISFIRTMLVALFKTTASYFNTAHSENPETRINSNDPQTRDPNFKIMNEILGKIYSEKMVDAIFYNQTLTQSIEFIFDNLKLDRSKGIFEKMLDGIDVGDE